MGKYEGKLKKIIQTTTLRTCWTTKYFGRDQSDDLISAPADEGSQTAKDGAENDPSMEVVENGKKVSAVSGKTLKNEHGNYPVWVSKRKIAQIKHKKNKTTKHVEGKVVKQKGVVRKRRF